MGDAYFPTTETVSSETVVIRKIKGKSEMEKDTTINQKTRKMKMEEMNPPMMDDVLRYIVNTILHRLSQGMTIDIQRMLVDDVMTSWINIILN